MSNPFIFDHDDLSKDVTLVDESQCRAFQRLSELFDQFPWTLTVSFHFILSRSMDRYSYLPQPLQYSVDSARLLPYRARGMLQTFIVEP